MKIHLTSCETHPGAWRLQEQMLREQWERSSHQHCLVESPAEADIILIANVREERWFESLRNHPVICKYPNRCFVIAEFDDPKPLLRGVYTSAHRHLKFPFRFRNGAYTLQHPDFDNPYIANHPGGAFRSPKKYLFSFTGRNCHPVRAAVLGQRFEREDVFVKDTSEFNLFTHQKDAKPRSQEFFTQVMESSKFAVCPRGYGASSIRLFEAMKIGVAPIIISDSWILPKGPCWNDFALFVKEGEIGNLQALAVRNEERWQEMGALAAREYERHFSKAAYFDYVVAQCADLLENQPIAESVFWGMRHLFVWRWKAVNRCRRLIERLR